MICTNPDAALGAQMALYTALLVYSYTLCLLHSADGYTVVYTFCCRTEIRQIDPALPLIQPLARSVQSDESDSPTPLGHLTKARR